MSAEKMFTKAELRLIRREVTWNWPPHELNPRRERILSLVAKIDGLLAVPSPTDETRAGGQTETGR